MKRPPHKTMRTSRFVVNGEIVDRNGKGPTKIRLYIILLIYIWIYIYIATRRGDKDGERRAGLGEGEQSVEQGLQFDRRHAARHTKDYPSFSLPLFHFFLSNPISGENSPESGAAGAFYRPERGRSGFRVRSVQFEEFTKAAEFQCVFEQSLAARAPSGRSLFLRCVETWRQCPFGSGANRRKPTRQK